MALTEAEELELLELEAAEAQSAQNVAPPQEEPAIPESRTRKMIKRVAGMLPIAGSIAVPTIGALSSGGVSLPATAALAGVGGAGGEAAKQLILRSLGETEGVPQTSMEAAKEIGKEGAINAALTYGGGKLFQGAGKALKLGKKLAFAPKAEEVVQAGKEKLIEIGERGAEKLGLARSTEAAAKEGLIGAEEKAGLHFATSPGYEKFIGDPKKVASFIQKISPLLKQGPSQLAQSTDSQTLQLLRKIAQESEKSTTLSDIAKAQLREIKDIMTQALGESEPLIGEQLGRFREAGKVVKEIPGQIKEQLLKQKTQTGKDVLDAKKIERTRKLVKAGLAAGAAYIGAKSIFK